MPLLRSRRLVAKALATSPPELARSLTNSAFRAAHPNMEHLPGNARFAGKGQPSKSANLSCLIAYHRRRYDEESTRVIAEF